MARSRSQPAGESIARNTAFSLLIQLGSSAFTAALTLFLVRRLDPQGFGTYGLALSIAALLTLPSDFGVTASAMRFIAEHRGDRDAVARLMADALRLKLLASGTVSIALFLLAPVLADGFGSDALAWPLRAMAVALLGQSLMLLFSGALIAQARTSLELRIVLSESATETAATVALVLLGAGATGATFGRAIGYGVGATVGLAVLARLIGRSGFALRRGSGSGSRLRAIARYAGALAVIDWVHTFFAYLDSLVIGGLLDTAAVGRFQAPMRIVGFLNMPAAAISSGVAPRLAAHEQGRNVAAFVAALRGLIVIQGLFLAPLLAWAEPIAHLLFGDGYGASTAVLRAIAPYVFLLGLGTLVSQAANYLGAARLRVPIAVVTLLVNLTLDLVLVPRIGIVAGAIGTGVAYAIYVPAHVLICHRILDLPLARLGLSLLRTGLAAGATAGVLLALGPSHLSLAGWLAGLLAMPLVYLAALLATRELTPATLREAAAAVRGRLGSRT